MDILKKIVNSKKKSNLSKGPNVARPMKNFDGSILTTSGYIVSPEQIIAMAIPIISTYEINNPIFFLEEIDVLAVKNSVIMK